MTGSADIFVALSTFAEHDRRPLQALMESGLPYGIHQSGKRITTPELLREGREAAVIIAGVEPYDRKTIEQLERLRCIGRCGTGVDNIDLPSAKERGIVVFNTPEAPTAAVAELALTMMLSLSRSLPRQIRSMAAKEWTRYEAHQLAGRRIGLIGFGKIGRRVARISQAFEAQVMAFDPIADAKFFDEWGVRSAATLNELLEWSEIVSIHASRSGSQPLRLGREEIGRMRPGAILINVARGDMIDEVALADALGSKHLAGAGLDVFPNEPYTGPLCDFDNVVLTPHCAALTVETRAAMEMECVDKAVRFLRGFLSAEERVI